MADQDIRQVMGQFTMFASISLLFYRWRGVIVCSQTVRTGWEAMAGFAPSGFPTDVINIPLVSIN